MVAKRIPQHLQDWIDARSRHKLSHAQIQMARELGMNPKRLGKLDNHRQQPWKAPLPLFIEDLYQRRFGKDRPDVVVTVEERARLDEHKKQAKREAKLARKLQLNRGDTPAADDASPSSRTDGSGQSSSVSFPASNEQTSTAAGPH